MQQTFTVADVVPEDQAVPPGASVNDLRAGAWVSEDGWLVVRNFAQRGDRCERCDHDIVGDLKREYCEYRVGTDQGTRHPDGRSVVECFDWAACDGREAAQEFGGAFPAEVCCTQFPVPTYSRWASDQVTVPAVVLDRWFPPARRSLALAGRAISIWANAETVTGITAATVTWERPKERFGARAEYVDMFAAAAHGLAPLEIARALDPDGRAYYHYYAFGQSAARAFATKRHLFAYPGFWHQPILDAVIDAIAPLILTSEDQPTPLLRDVALTLESVGCTLNAASARQLRSRLDIPTVEAVDWRVGLHPDYASSTRRADRD